MTTTRPATLHKLQVVARSIAGKLLEAAHDKASAILKQNRELLDQTAEKLLAKETLSADELPKRVAFVSVPAPALAAG